MDKKINEQAADSVYKDAVAGALAELGDDDDDDNISDEEIYRRLKAAQTAILGGMKKIAGKGPDE